MPVPPNPMNYDAEPEELTGRALVGRIVIALLVLGLLFIAMSGGAHP